MDRRIRENERGAIQGDPGAANRAMKDRTRLGLCLGCDNKVPGSKHKCNPVYAFAVSSQVDSLEQLPGVAIPGKTVIVKSTNKAYMVMSGRWHCDNCYGWYEIDLNKRRRA